MMRGAQQQAERPGLASGGARGGGKAAGVDDSALAVERDLEKLKRQFRILKDALLHLRR
jgi:hypothetical protein